MKKSVRYMIIGRKYNSVLINRIAIVNAVGD